MEEKLCVAASTTVRLTTTISEAAEEAFGREAAAASAAITLKVRVSGKELASRYVYKRNVTST